MPEFTTDEGKPEEVKEVQEKETPSDPPTEEKPVSVEPEKQDIAPTKDDLRAALGLQGEIARLRAEIVELRGTKRELKKEELFIAEKHLDDLADVNPDDAKLIDRVLRSKGYVTKDEASKMYYKTAQDEELAKFLEKYPEYKPQNDPSDANWSSLQAELALYKMPENPHKIREILERAHKSISKGSIDTDIPVKKKALEVASVGAGGITKSSSKKSLDPAMRRRLEDGGWSKEEIEELAK